MKSLIIHVINDWYCYFERLSMSFFSQGFRGGSLKACAEASNESMTIYIENSECAKVVKYTENFICKMIFASISIETYLVLFN